jgi:hypothetical protein
VEKAQDSYKSRMAQKWGIPVVSVSFIERSVEGGKLLEADEFVVAGKTASQELSTGKIVASLQDRTNSDKKKKRTKSMINLNQLKVWPWPHPDPSMFPEANYEIVRHSFLKKFDKMSKLTSFASIEIHVAMKDDVPQYRVFVHRGHLERKDKNGEVGVSECRYVDTPLDVEAVYTHLYKQFSSSPHSMERVQYLTSFVGSPGLRKVTARCPCCRDLLLAADSRDVAWGCGQGQPAAPPIRV